MFLSVYEWMPWDNVIRTQVGFLFFIPPCVCNAKGSCLSAEHTGCGNLWHHYLRMFEKGKGSCLSTQSSNRNNLPHVLGRRGGGLTIYQGASSKGSGGYHASANRTREQKGCPFFSFLCGSYGTASTAHCVGWLIPSFFFLLVTLKRCPSWASRSVDPPKKTALKQYCALGGQR